MSVTFSLRHGKDIEGQYGPEPEFWLNCHNVGARGLLTLLGIYCDPDDLYGTIEGTLLDVTIKAALKALNDSQADYSREGYDTRWTPGKCRVIDAGCNDEIMRHRLRTYLELAREAKRTNDSINFG